MKNLLMFLKRRGFTLVEALIVTVLAGYCILPIVGTLQSGQTQTASFDHREKLRTLTRSRLNKELAAGAFDHTAINTLTTYHYMFYKATGSALVSIDADVASDVFIATQVPASVSSILYSYKISVNVKENLALATTTKNIDSKFTTGLSGLKALTVLTELEPNDNVLATDSFSLFSLLNLPSSSDDYIWISNPKNAEIIAIDPVSRTKVESILLPVFNESKRDDGANDNYRPWNIAVHPNKKFLIIQCKYKIMALNIDRSSESFGKPKDLWTTSDAFSTAETSGTQKLALVTKEDKTAAGLDRSITFRPDGNMCYVSANDDKKVFAFVASNTTSWDNLKLLTPPTSYYYNTVAHNFLHAGKDGWLYLGLKDENQTLRFPMFARNIFADQPQVISDTKKILALDTSSDGQEFYILWETNIVSRHESSTGKKIAQSVFTPTPSGVINDIKLSSDGRYLGLVDAGDGVGKGGFFLQNLSINPIDGTAYALTNTAIFKKADPNNLGKKEKIEYCLFVPQSGEFVFDDAKKPFIFSVDIPGLGSDSYATGLPDDRTINFASPDKSQVAMAVRPVDYVLVGSYDSNKGYIEYVDTDIRNDADPVKRQPVESLQIELATAPACIALTRNGEKMRVGFGPNRAGIDLFATYGSRTRLNAVPEGAQWIYGVTTPNEKFAVDATATMFVTMDYHPSLSWANGYWGNLPLPSPVPTGYRSPADVDITNGWQGQDIEALHNGGILILYRNTTTNSSILEWIGKHRWGPFEGKYERFARWHSTANNFPPHNARNIAISADDRYLAIEAASTPNRIYLYDFAVNDFGNNTQQNGLLVDYRVKNSSPWHFDEVMSNCSFSVPSPTLTAANGIKLRDSTTASDSWMSQRTYPANYLTDPSDALIAGTNHSNKQAANKRFIGYLKPTTDTAMLAIAEMDFARLFFNFKPAVENPSESEGVMEFPADLSADNQAAIQLDTCRAQSSQRKIKGGAAVTGWEADPCLTGTPYYNAASIDDCGDIPEAIYQYHRFAPSGNLVYNVTGIPDGSAKVRLHFCENFWDDDGERLFNVLIEGIYVENNLDVHQRAGGENKAIALTYEVTVSGGDGLQIVFERTTTDNPMIAGIEIWARGSSYLGIFSNSTAGTSAGAVTKTVNTPNESSLINMTGWNNIPSTNTMPFSFQPAFLADYPLTSAIYSTSSGMTFSRDAANPILYVLDGFNDVIWCMKPGKPVTRINLDAIDVADKQLVISNDGQKLLYARRDGNKELIMVDIANPNNFNFNGTARTQSSLTGFGSVIGKAPMFGTPNVLANMPFNAYKSTSRGGSYEFIATLSNYICGVNNAAVASGGIYIMGGSTVETGAVNNTIYSFNPVASIPAIISPMVATLPHSLQMHTTVAYDDQIYAFNGYDSTDAIITDLVQRFDPNTRQVMGFQPPILGAATEFQVSATMVNANAPFPNTVSDNGTAVYSGEEGYRAFEGDTSKAWSSTSCGKEIIYDFGWPTLSPIVNKIWVNNASTYYNNGVNQFHLLGSNDGTTWIPLTDGYVPKGSTGWSSPIFANTTPYRKYKFVVDTNHGGSTWVVRELKLINANVRKISPVNMRAATKDGKTVSSSQEGAGASWLAFDGRTGSSYEWDTGTGGSFPRWIAVNLGGPDNVNIIRMLCESGSNDGIKDFEFQGSISASPALADSAADVADGWVTIPSISGTALKQPNNGIWNTFYLNNSRTDFQCYRVKCTNTWGSSEIEVWEMEFYSTQILIPGSNQTNLTKTMTDNLGPVQVKENAGCMTPYGIVLAGGVTDAARTTATTTCLVYWPHGFNEYNSQTDFSQGICRSLPNLNIPVADHCLVWHKGKLYRIGGATPTGAGAGTALTNYESFDFSDNKWTTTTPTNTLFNRRKAAACSHGDEIFIFGGRSSTAALTTAAAWNPTTNEYRQLTDVPKLSTYAMTAVSCGSSIYLIGGANAYNMSGSATILKYTP